VLRLERNAAHPLVALMLTKSVREWKDKVWDYAGKVISDQAPEEIDDW